MKIPFLSSIGLGSFLLLSCLEDGRIVPSPNDPSPDDSSNADILWPGTLYGECDTTGLHWMIHLGGDSVLPDDQGGYFLRIGVSLDSVYAGATFEQGPMFIHVDSIDSDFVWGTFEVRGESDTTGIEYAGRVMLEIVTETPACQGGLACEENLPPIQLVGEGTWISHPNPQKKTLTSIVWTGERLVAVGEEGTIMTSPDGEAWAERASGTTAPLYAVACASSGVVAVGGGGTILTSPDGVVWTAAVSGTTNTLSALIWTGTQFVAVGYEGTILTSPDGVAWNVRLSSTTKWLRALAASDSLFVTVGDSGTILTSTDGIVWLSRSSGISQPLITAVRTQSHFIAYSGTVINPPGGGPSSVALESPDGALWTTFQWGGSNPVRPYFHHLKRMGDQLAGISYHPLIGSTEEVVRVSPDDGMSWVSLSISPSVFFARDLAWTGEKVVVVGTNGGILTFP